jgi:tartrate/fumarate subfamily iron-sulfur-dependent hydro-lyase beta chain
MVTPVRINSDVNGLDVLALNAGDVVLISGMIFTGRDRVHKHLSTHSPSKGEMPFDIHGGILYHCGPVMERTADGYMAVAAGPTTSMRMEMYEPYVIEQFGIKGIIGKGGMGPKTRDALKENGCVYMQTVGGAAVFLADRIERTAGVWKLNEFGIAEAMWFFEVRDFPAMVTIDAHGNDLHSEIEERSKKQFLNLIRQ